MFENYREYLELEKGFSLHTVDAYGHDVWQFLTFLQSEGIELQEVDRLYFRSYFSYLNQKRKITKRTQARKVNSLRSFYRFLVREGILDKNQAREFSTPRHKTSLPKPFYPNETEEILEKSARPDNRPDYLQLRDQVMVELLYSSGMRVSELVSVDIGSVEQLEAVAAPGDRSAKLKVLGKGGKERYVFLGRKICSLLSEYLPRRAEFASLRKSSSLALFLNNNGRRLSARGVRYVLKNLDSQLDVARGVHPHRMRHTFATDLLNSGADIRAVQEMLGHASLSTTQKYIQISRERLRDVYRQAHPHARLRRKDEDEKIIRSKSANS